MAPYHHVVLVVQDVPRFDAEKQSRAQAVLESAGEVENLPVAQVDFEEDRAHVYAENPEGQLPIRVSNAFQVRSQREYRHAPNYYDSNLWWNRSLHVETVEELPA